jgi:hypothetical protein
MSDPLTFDYEFQFTNNFDINVYNNCSISLSPEDNTIRQNLIEDLTLKLKQIISEVPGIHVFSSFQDFNGSRYKITFTHS